MHEPDYEHRQVATVILAALGMGVAVTAAVVAISLSSDQPPGALIVAGTILAVLLACLGLFHALTVRVTARAVEAAFGPGLIRRTIPMDRIRGVRVVRNHWYNGWGVRWIPAGWMFNASGFDAVELELAHGRRFRIGTDDPEGLRAAIARRLPGTDA